MQKSQTLKLQDSNGRSKHVQFKLLIFKVYLHYDPLMVSLSPFKLNTRNKKLVYFLLTLKDAVWDFDPLLCVDNFASVRL